ncbi:hypothetical protein N7G274_009922 [Stereocaulon virgatum]|uniref:Zn(2)-C6 fungal-type domain-containing protein n=1 Tax=Stereocaulon virgatum TaxID=373712 RepID=A0ABR3ZV06_9LECA
MPGILPMKVIKVGTSAQSRIAQACDRCRSKKIRCDGITPCCSQCANVGFECKTSDKLSRRAFPRGYTESLEERVRALETEVKELKDLLDEKDEKIDILSRIHSNSPSLRRPSSTISSSVDLAEIKEATSPAKEKEDTFRVQQSPCLLDGEESETYFMGASSGRSFVDTFKAKAQESGKPCSEFKTSVFFTPRKKDASITRRSLSAASKVPSRMVSDHMVNIFFQEWAPLFPILHKPTALKVYTDYVTDPSSVKDKHSIAQLNLIFGIAALSAEWNKQSADGFETQWQAALDSVLAENTLPTLQCLVLAQIHCIAKADYNKLLHYKGMAISLSHRLGLHQSQKRFSLGALTSETRKKVFWSLYTLDCFSAALLGLPKLLNEGDIHAEYPADVDDENVSERGFQSTLPGESTRLSSALALFRLSRVMSKVLDENYPAASSHDLSLQKSAALNDDLDAWLGSLPNHLRLHFVQDKPSTSIVGSRSPLLSLGYHYVRTLIHRPAVGSTLGTKASSSVVALAQSSKHIIQIIQLLEERRMSFSFCLNKNELLLLAGFGLLFQGLNLDRKGKLIQDSQRLLCSVIEILERNNALGAADFKKVACAMISVDRFSKDARAMSDGNMSAPKNVSRSSRKLQAIASRFTSGNSPAIRRETSNGRRSTAPTLPTAAFSIYDRSNSTHSLSSTVSDPMPRNGYSNSRTDSLSPRRSGPLKTPNLDYLSFNEEPSPSPHQSSPNLSRQSKDNDMASPNFSTSAQHTQAAMDSLFPNTDMFSSYLRTPPAGTIDWCPDIWNMSSDMGNGVPPAPSYSEEELTSGEELSSCDTGRDFNGLSMSNVDSFVGLEGLDGTFGL